MRTPEVKASPALSLLARPGDGSIRTRNIALLVASGVDGEDIDVEVTLEAAPSVVFDAVVIPDGEVGVRMLAGAGQAIEFVKDQFRHCKTILALGAGEQLLAAAHLPPKERPWHLPPAV